MKIYQYIRYKKEFFGGGLLKLIEVALEIILPILMGMMLDYAINADTYNFAFLMIGTIFFFAIFGFVSTYISHVLVAKVTTDFARNVRNDVFSKVLDFSYDTRAKFTSLTLVNRMNNDVLTLQNALGMTMRIATRAPFLLIGSLVAILIINWQIGLILLAGYAVLVLAVGLLCYFLMKLYRRVQINRDLSDRIVRENIRGIRVVRSYGKQKYEQAKFENQTDTLIKEQKKTAFVSAISSPLATLLLNVVLVVMLYFTANSINIGTLTPGNALSMISYTAQLLTATIALLNIILLYARSIISYERLDKVLKENCIIDGNQDMKQYDITFDHASLGFNPEQKNLINDINLTIPYGAKVGVVGITGTGKSILIKAINKYITPIDGDIKVGDISLKEISIASHSEHIGYVPQTKTLMSGTVLFNITLGFEYPKELIDKVLQIVNLSNDDKFLNSLVHEEGTNLSGGQRQRIAIARALIIQPQILLFDDVFSALDGQNRSLIKNNLYHLKTKPTLIFTATAIKDVIDCDKIIFIEDNKVSGYDAHLELLKNNQAYKTLYERQG